jgi:hypothetical protein
MNILWNELVLTFHCRRLEDTSYNEVPLPMPR